MSGSPVNFKAISPFDLAVAAAAPLLFIAMFFQSYGITIEGGGEKFEDGVNGWHWAGFWVPFIFLVLPAVAIIVILNVKATLIPANVPVSPRLIVVALLGLALLIMLIRSLTFPDDGADEAGADVGISYGTVVVLLIVIGATVAAVLGFKKSGDPLPKAPRRAA